MKATIIAVASIFLSGCAIISPRYVPSSGERLEAKSADNLAVYYSAADVPFAYKEIGRVFLKNMKGAYYPDAGAQIDKIRKVAAAKGAQAVIILKESKLQGSATGAGGLSTADIADQIDYSGVAIVQK